jgi:hypothetical protein
MAFNLLSQTAKKPKTKLDRRCRQFTTIEYLQSVSMSHVQKRKWFSGRCRNLPVGSCQEILGSYHHKKPIMMQPTTFTIKVPEEKSLPNSPAAKVATRYLVAVPTHSPNVIQ